MTVLADIVWPGVILADRLMGAISVGVGLIVEAMVLRWAFGMSWLKAIVADVAMNAASTVPSAYLVVGGGLAWEVGPGRVLYTLLHIGTFNPITWAATCLLAVVANTLIEMTVLRLFFKVPFVLRSLAFIAGANAISVVVAFASLTVSPARH